MASILSVLINLAHRMGISPLMLRARRAVRSRGERLRFTFFKVIWERPNEPIILLPGMRPHFIWRLVYSPGPNLEKILAANFAVEGVIDLSNGSRFRMPSGRYIWLTDFIEDADTHTGYFAKGEPKPGDIAVDVGAYGGELTIELAIRVGPSGHVYALEPDPANRTFLMRNIAMHNLTNVTVLPYALWSKTAVLSFVAAGDFGSIIRDPGIQPWRRGKAISVSTLSPLDLIARIGRVPAFFKMDIEGAEVELIEVLAPVLASSSRAVRLAIASYHIRDGRPTHEIISPLLLAAGFKVETGYPAHTTTWAWTE
jgi:FkbM family methyltransferase